MHEPVEQAIERGDRELMLNELKGRGLRERILRRAGAGDLYDRLNMLETERLALRRQLAACAVPPSAAAEPLVSAPDEECARLLELRALNRLITIDFPVRPRLRFGWDLPPHPQLLRRLSAREDHYSATLKTFLPLLPRIAGIPAHPTADPTEPNWINLAFPALDAIALYGLLVLYRPADTSRSARASPPDLHGEPSATMTCQLASCRLTPNLAPKSIRSATTWCAAHLRMCRPRPSPV